MSRVGVEEALREARGWLEEKRDNWITGYLRAWYRDAGPWFV